MGNGKSKMRLLSAALAKEREAITRDVMEKLLVGAVQEHDTDSLAQLSKYRDINGVLTSGENVLTCAVKAGDVDVVALLITLGADSNMADSNGRTPLHVAVSDGKDNMLTTLLTYGADPSQFDSSGLNALHLASELGRRTMLPKLLAVGARPNDPCATGEKSNPIILAASNGHSECIKVLVSAGGMVDLPDAWGNSALLKSISLDQEDCVRTLIEQGASVNARNRSGTSALQNALIRGNHNVIELLLEKKCSVSDYSNDLPPLHAATLNGCKQCIDLILAAGMSTECVDNHRRTAFYMAVADQPNVDHYYRYYPLKENATRIHCARALVKKGTNVGKIWKTKFWNTRYRSPEQMALYRLCIRAYGFYRVSASVLRDIFHKATLSGCMDTVKLVASAGYRFSDEDLEYFSSSGEPASKCACAQFEDDDQYPPCSIPHEEMVNWVNDVRSRPRTLKDMCRLKLRASMTNNVFTYVGRLSIPDNLKSYLMIESQQYYV